jgi:hypothetical protein
LHFSPFICFFVVDIAENQDCQSVFDFRAVSAKAVFVVSPKCKPAFAYRALNLDIRQSILRCTRNPAGFGLSV